MKLSEQQKADKRQRDALQHVCNKLTSNFSFKLIKTWRDVYVTVGIDSATIVSTYSNADSPITFPELKAYCTDLKAKLETTISGRTVVPVAIPTVSAPTPAAPPTVEVAEPQVVEPLPTEPQLTNKLDEDYGLVPSANEKAFLYWFQKKATAELLTGFGIR